MNDYPFIIVFHLEDQCVEPAEEMLKVNKLFWDVLAYLFINRRNHHILKDSDENRYFVDLFCKTEKSKFIYSKAGILNILQVCCPHWDWMYLANLIWCLWLFWSYVHQLPFLLNFLPEYDLPTWKSVLYIITSINILEFWFNF